MEYDYDFDDELLFPIENGMSEEEKKEVDRETALHLDGKCSDPKTCILRNYKP